MEGNDLLTKFQDLSNFYEKAEKAIKEAEKKIKTNEETIAGNNKKISDYQRQNTNCENENKELAEKIKNLNSLLEDVKKVAEKSEKFTAELSGDDEPDKENEEPTFDTSALEAVEKGPEEEPVEEAINEPVEEKNTVVANPFNTEPVGVGGFDMSGTVKEPEKADIPEPDVQEPVANPAMPNNLDLTQDLSLSFGDDEEPEEADIPEPDVQKPDVQEPVATPAKPEEDVLSPFSMDNSGIMAPFNFDVGTNAIPKPEKQEEDDDELPPLLNENGIPNNDFSTIVDPLSQGYNSVPGDAPDKFYHDGIYDLNPNNAATSVADLTDNVSREAIQPPIK